ncbi:hypothetical protein DFJ77DRAFT_454728 [Powellomyces hirtus]|nr:hypothetical protein DFJ77DRAFT_454728 [Powellomyces hirtus]
MSSPWMWISHALSMYIFFLLDFCVVTYDGGGWTGEIEQFHRLNASAGVSFDMVFFVSGCERPWLTSPQYRVCICERIAVVPSSVSIRDRGPTKSCANTEMASRARAHVKCAVRRFSYLLRYSRHTRFIYTDGRFDHLGASATGFRRPVQI